MAPSSLPQAAECYAKAGWHIFPVKPQDKIPLTAHGVKDATSDVLTVRGWWKKWPNANIGLNCGKSEIVVIDLDCHGDHSGIEEWSEIAERNQLVVNTATSVTGGGGRHLLFKAPDGISIKNSAGKLAPAIDVRGDGGYIVLPPSIHPSGRTYEWANTTTTLEQLPAVLVDLLTLEPDPWQIYTLRDALTPRPPVEWLVRGILQAGTLSVWFGAPGSLKSMALADLAVCIAAGQDWLTDPKADGYGYATSRRPVLWLDFDNGARRTHERFAALARSRSLGADLPLYYVSMPEPHLDAGDTTSIGALANRIVARDIGLVVVDNLGVVSGEADENSAEMQRPMQGLRWLVEATGTALAVLHHERKTSGVAGRSGERMRGHSSIEAKLDLAVMISRTEENIEFEPTKNRGPEVKKFSALWAYEQDEHQELRSARLWHGQVEAEERLDSQRREATIIEEVQGARLVGISANRLYELIGGNRSNLLDTLRQMEKNGRIVRKQGSKGYLIFPA